MTAVDSEKTLRPLRRRQIRSLAPWWFASPAAAVFLFVIVAPSVQAIAYSFTNWDGFAPSFKFVGFANYVDALSGKYTLLSIRNTLVLTGLITIFQLAIGLVLALALNSNIRSRNLLRVLFFAPVVLTSVAVGYIWKFVLSPTGVLNQMLGAVGLDILQHDWLGDPATNLFAIAGVTVWQSVGFTMVIYLAGLQSVPDEVLEAAHLDGASAWARFWFIVRPLIAPATLVNSVLCVVGGLKLFDIIYVMTSGGPAYTTSTLAVLVYTNGFVPGDYTLGVTLSVVLSVLVAVVSIVQFRVLRGRRG